METKELIGRIIQDIREWYDVLFKALNGNIENLDLDIQLNTTTS